MKNYIRSLLKPRRSESIERMEIRWNSKFNKIGELGAKRWMIFRHQKNIQLKKSNIIFGYINFIILVLQCYRSTWTFQWTQCRAQTEFTFETKKYSRHRTVFTQPLGSLLEIFFVRKVLIIVNALGTSPPTHSTIKYRECRAILNDLF